MHKIKFSLSEKSISDAIKQLDDYRKKVENLGKEIAYRLSQLGYDVVYSILSDHVFTGETLDSLKVEEKGEGKYFLIANSKAILFFEFGAGVRYGNGHPIAKELGFGPGTYPGKGHWDDPNGWWYPTDDPRLIVKYDKNGQGYGHSYGNPPYMPFYTASKQMRENILSIAKELLK